jgi:hypothetical protein
MTNDKDYLNRIEEIMEFRRKENPINQEVTNLFNDMFPTKQFESVLRLGYAWALSDIKNHVSPYMCKDCNKYIDEVIKVNKTEEVMKKYLDRFIRV